MARPDRLFWTRMLGRMSWLVALSLVLLVAFSRCGTEKAKDKGNDTPTVTTPTGEVPAAWDGQSDWTDSPFEVVEE